MSAPGTYCALLARIGPLADCLRTVRTELEGDPRRGPIVCPTCDANAMLTFFILAIIAGVCLAGWLAIALIVGSSRAQKKAEANAPAILDAAFDGRDNVVFKINMESLSFETVMLGAKARGYLLASQSQDTEHSQTLIFEKAQQPKAA